MLTDVAYNWRKAKSTGRASLPSLGALQSGLILASHNTVVLAWGSWGDDVIEVRDWLAEHATSGHAVRLFARVEWHQYKFTTDKTLIGLTFQFSNMVDLLYFKLRWQVGCQPEVACRKRA